MESSRSIAKLNLREWVDENRDRLRPPVSNRQLFPESADAIVFVSGGPNTRNDFHVNPTEELFFQLTGDIAVRVRPLDGSPPHDVVVREGEMYLLPRWLPHRPQRPAGTVGLVIEFPRGLDARGRPQEDALRWYCAGCDTLVYEARWVLKKIDEDLKRIMEDFWGGPEERRRCPSCGTVIERAGEFTLGGRAPGESADGTSGLAGAREQAAEAGPRGAASAPDGAAAKPGARSP
ncbi:MAG TPA: 3-hydroxyanthranilate 3,4-dioxygenase [Phycisphaerales bacterium]|nr:3-hydroxyanthranilate 3,4-dioxygenase [Phycisphaerales bacterium]